MRGFGWQSACQLLLLVELLVYAHQQMGWAWELRRTKSRKNPDEYSINHTIKAARLAGVGGRGCVRTASEVIARQACSMATAYYLIVLIVLWCCTLADSRHLIKCTRCHGVLHVAIPGCLKQVPGQRAKANSSCLVHYAPYRSTLF